MADTKHVPESLKKPSTFEQSMVFCEIKKDEKGERKVSLNIDSNLIPKEIQTQKDAYEYVNKKLFGTENAKVASETLCRTAHALPQTMSEEERYNLVLNSCQEMKPKDVIEARLSSKETVLYTTAMQYMARAEKALQSDAMGSHLWHETYMQYAIKLLRVHNETVDALGRYRRQGEQRVVVQHVSVSDGGQAIVGQMIADRVGGSKKNEE